MFIDISKVPIGALLDYKSMIECALVRAEVNEDVLKYKKFKEDLDKIKSEISARQFELCD